MDSKEPFLPKSQSPPLTSDYQRGRARSDTNSTTSSVHTHSRKTSLVGLEGGAQGSPRTRSFPIKPLKSTNPTSPTTSPQVPIFKALRPSMEKHASAGSRDSYGPIDIPRGSVEDTDTLSTHKPHMIRGKWVAARLRTICYMFMWASALTTFVLVAGIYKRDYLPHRTEVDSRHFFNKGQFSSMQDGQGRGYNIHAWPDPNVIDLNGVYMILAFCGAGTGVFFALWLQNTYRSARSYYVRFTRFEVFSLLLLIIFGIGFGATAGYVTYTFKLDNNYNDFWSYTCSRHTLGEAQVMAYKGIIYYDGDCHMLTGAWITLLVLCGFSFFALLTFPINIIYHVLTKHTHYSRFEQRLSKVADQEDRLVRRASLRPRHPWKMPKWAKIPSKK